MRPAPPRICMIFGGIQETTLLDFPGRVSCVLFTAGCNFKCPYCHNPELLSFSTANIIRQNVVFDFLRERAGFLDGVVITGGEPTLHKDLREFMASLKDMGFEVKLDTNGSRPGALEEILHDGLADYVAMDLKTRPALYPEMVASPAGPEAIRKSARLILDSGLDHEFRTTCARPMVDENNLLEMARLISGARLWVFQECRKGRMLVPDFLDGGGGEAHSAGEIEEFSRRVAPYVHEVRQR